MILLRSTEFKKAYKKLSKKLQDKVNERLAIFLVDEFNGILDNHKLNGEYENCRSINVTGDYRIIYRKPDNTTYFLMRVGTHPQLYG